MPQSATSTPFSRDPSTSRLSVRSAQDGNASSGLEKFPDFDNNDAPMFPSSGFRSASPVGLGLNGFGQGMNGGAANMLSSADRWIPRKENQSKAVQWGETARSPSQGRNGHQKQQKSIGDAFRAMRGRNGSVSDNAHELAGALRAPVSPKLIILCLMWYTSSALTNTSSKSILNAFDKPATLTLIQFFLVALYCLASSWAASVFPKLRTSIPALRHPIRYPSRDVLVTTLPLAAFQIGGHLLSSTATSKIPVSLVHTVKGLSPLFTVLAYRFVFNIRYPVATYFSLIPLTLGVMLACSGKHNFGGELLGLFYALLATVIFVTQNIFSKRLFNEAAQAEAIGLSAKSRKLDKLNLLCYSSGMAFILTMPIWFWSEGLGLLRELYSDGSLDLTEKPNTMDHGRLFVEFLFNGTFHFGQNILAFVLLSLVSPVTYSVASLLKRVFVIVVAIVWFRNATTMVQGVGIALTFIGLYLYDRTSESNKADRRARLLSQSNGRDQPLLPLNTQGPFAPTPNATIFESPLTQSVTPSPHPYTSASLANGSDDDLKKNDEAGTGRQRGNSSAAWLAPGTRQEHTWRFEDRVQQAQRVN